MTALDSGNVLADVSSWNWIHWIGVVLSAGIAAVNLYVGYAHSEQVFFLIGAGFLVGIGLFFTRLWAPVLYLLGLLYVAVLGVIWIFAGMLHFELGIVNGVLSVGLAVILLYLFFTEGAATESPE